MRKIIDKFLFKFGYYNVKNQVAKYNYCQTCKSGFKILPIVDNVNYCYQEEFKIDQQPEYNDDNLKIYGWAIQVRYDYYGNGYSKWSEHWNHKIYKSKTDTIDAIINMKVNPSYRSRYKIDFRAIPLYHIDQHYFRSLAIKKIFKS